MRDVMEWTLTTARRGFAPAKVTSGMGVDDAVGESAFWQLQLSIRDKTNALVDALPSCCRLIGTCGHARKVSRSQRICWTVMYRKPTSHVGHVVWIFENFGSMRHSISSEPFIHLISDRSRGDSNLRIPDIRSFRRTLGISRSENGSV